MKNRFRTLLSLTMIGILPHAMAAYEENELQWLNTSSGNAQTVTNNGTGTWTIGMNLNVSGLNAILQGKDNGNALFSVKGDGYYTQVNNYIFWQETENVSYADRNMTVTMGWGGDWYASLNDATGLAGNAVPPGLQLGVTSKKDPANLSGGSLSGFNVYVADMKRQEGANGGVHDGANGSYDWSISETGKATATTLDQIATMTTIDQATLFVTHTYANDPKDQLGQLTNDTDRDYASDKGNYKTDITYTTFYLTVIGKDANGKEVVYNFMGQQDDKSTFGSAQEGSMAGGSAWYDVDMLKQITINNPGLVDSMVFVDHALTSADRAQLMANGLPEPTTATLSLMALAGLAARRRRR